MGYHIHHTIVVTSWDKKYLKVAHAKAKKIFGSLTSNMTKEIMNGYCSFFVAPDGSKEGWRMSTEYDEKRAEFLKWLQAKRDKECWVEWVEVSFGGDEPGQNTHILEYYRS